MKTLKDYATLTPADKDALTGPDLVQLCDGCGLDPAGPRTRKIAALDRMAAAAFPEIATVVTTRYSGSATRCPSCGFSVMVNGTAREKLDGGRTLLTRSMKCLGPDNHKFPLKEIIVPAETKKDDPAPASVKSEPAKKTKKQPAAQSKQAVL